MATAGTLDAEERRQRLLETLQLDGTLRLEAAAEALGVSAMTVRRDLLDLETEGLLRRVRGGAVLRQGARPFGERRSTRSKAKAIIAAKAKILLPKDGAVAFDASTTVASLALLLRDAPALTVASNSYETFSAARSAPDIEAVLIGGAIEARTESFVGPLACRAASSLLYERFFTSASALDPVHGTSEVSLEESEVKLAFAASAREIVLCVDSSKLGTRSIAVCLSPEHLSTIVTELDPDDPRLDPYRPFARIL